MARKQKDIATKQDVILDPETNQPIVFSQEATFLLEECERRIKVAALEMGMALRRIRDDRLYLMRDCSSMEEYIMRAGIAVRTARLYMQLADRFHQLPQSDELLKANPQQVVKLLKDEDTFQKMKSGEISFESGKVILPDQATGEAIEIPLYDYLREQRAKLRVEMKGEDEKTKEQLAKEREHKRSLKHELEEYQQSEMELLNKINALESTIRKLTGPDTNPDDIVIVTTRKQAVDMLHRASVEISDYCGQIERIPQDLVDSELTGAITRTLASMDAALRRVTDAWAHLIINNEEA